MAQTCSTLGGQSFNPIGTGSIENRGSTNAVGRHGVSNLWNRWPKRGSKAGITARAPYNIGNPKTPPTLAGSTLHHRGLDLGAHGHGIGVVPAAIGGPHNPRSGVAVISDSRNRSGGFVITPSGFCFKCAGTWLFAGVAIVLFLVISGR